MKTYCRISIGLIFFLFFLASMSVNAQRRIKMEKEGSMYYIPCEEQALFTSI